jgi:hypothetical protein
MSLALPVLAALVVSLALGGSLRRLAELPLRATWLFFGAVVLQIAAFPFAFLPWTTGDATQKGLWLASYLLLLAAAVANRRLAGVPIAALGMLANLAAIVANGGRMPVAAEAMRAAGDSYAVRNNSIQSADPTLSWLVDRWAAPDWIPLANVFSVGDLVIAVGAFVIVFVAMRPRLPGLRPRVAPSRSA